MKNKGMDALKGFLPDELQKIADDGIIDIAALEQSDMVPIEDLSMIEDGLNAQLEELEQICAAADIDHDDIDYMQMARIRGEFARNTWETASANVLRHFNDQRKILLQAIAEELEIDADEIEAIL